MRIKRLAIWFIILPAVFVLGGAWLVWGGISNPAGRKAIGDIRAPIGYRRVEVKNDSFGEFLRGFPLQKRGSKMKHADGSLAMFQFIGYAVLDLPVLSGSEQCCDAVQRMRSEYLFSKGRYADIHFKSFQNGTMQYRGGGDKEALYKYLRRVYDASNTSTLRHELRKKDWDRIAPGDVLVYEAGGGRRVGHAVLVVDVAVNPGNGKKAVMVAQSCMPALTMHVVRNVRNPFSSPWFIIDEDDQGFRTTLFGFSKSDLRTW